MFWINANEPKSQSPLDLLRNVYICGSLHLFYQLQQNLQHAHRYINFPTGDNFNALQRCGEAGFEARASPKSGITADFETTQPGSLRLKGIWKRIVCPENGHCLVARGGPDIGGN